jgi:hypothetical protein
MKSDKVIVVEYIEAITGGTCEVGGFEHMIHYPGKETILYDGESFETADRFAVIPSHAYDLIEGERISREEWEARKHARHPL